MQTRAPITSLSSRVLRLGPLGLLVIIWLLSAYQSGGYATSQWLPLAILTAFVALLVVALRAYPEAPDRRLLLVLGLCALYVIWMALSIIWAMGRQSAWEESARAAFYLVFFALAVLYAVKGGGAVTGRGLLLLAALVMAGVAVGRLAAGDTLEVDFFDEKRYQFPLTYSNGTAGFYYLLIWPLLWMAADPRGRLWIRALSLGAVPPLLQLGLLTQSRGGLYALVISAVFYFLVSPARLRSLVFLTAPLVVVGLSFSPLAAYYTEGVDQVGTTTALLWLVGSWAGVSVFGLALAFADRKVPVARRLRLVVSVVVMVAVVGGLGFGIVTLHRRVGDIGEWVTDSVSEFMDPDRGKPSTGLAGTRFGLVGGSGRGILWRSGWQGFLDAPTVGNGAGSFGYINEIHRTNPRTDAKQAHSIELDQLGETGAVGFALFMAALVAVVGVTGAPRFRSWWALWSRRRPLLLDPADAGSPDAVDGAPTCAEDVAGQAWTAALMAAMAYWFMHASVDWIWHLPAVTLGALLLLALALSASTPVRDARPVQEAGAAPTAERRRSTRASLAPRTFGGTFRICLGIISLALLVATVLPYLSFQYERAALARVRTDPGSALEQTSTARALFPVSSEPFALRAYVYRALAQDAVALRDKGQSGSSVLDALALALAAEERAIAAEEASSVRHYQAGLATLDLLAARNPRLVFGAQAAGWTGTGLGSVSSGSPTDANQSLAMILAADDERETAEGILRLGDRELLERAAGHLSAALARNPLDARINELIAAVRDDPPLAE